MNEACDIRAPRLRLMAVLALGALAVAALLPAGRRTARSAHGSAPAEQGLRVAVVDMSTVLRGSQQWRDMAEERSRLLERMERTMTELTRQVQVLRNEYENQPPGEQRRRKAMELEQAAREREQKRQEFEQQVARSYSEATREMFAKITEVVGAYAQEQGLDLVLKKQTMEMEGPESLGRNIMLATTEVLYAEPRLDISDIVVERLNAAYPGPVEDQ
jgi:Skp family chaperone for outer membrane proteins